MESAISTNYKNTPFYGFYKKFNFNSAAIFHGEPYHIEKYPFIVLQFNESFTYYVVWFITEVYFSD